MKRSGLLPNAIVCVLVAAAVCAILTPALTQVKRDESLAMCQSNIKTIGNALKMYLCDWEDAYPTNRSIIRGNKLGPISSHIALATPYDSALKERLRFTHGINWVKALDPYIEAVSYNDDYASAWRCPVASSSKAKHSDTAVVTYAFNGNLAEVYESKIRSASNLMSVREMDRLVDAELRPVNRSKSSAGVPKSPFLSEYDDKLGATNGLLHSGGSNILFADGHVKLYSASYFPSKGFISKSNCWDTKNKRWYNYACTVKGKPAMCVRSIAVTP